MKKIFISAIVLLTSYIVGAQSTAPRWGTSLKNDNTFRTLTNRYISVVDGAAADSVAIFPQDFQTIYRITLSDSLCLKQPTVTSSFAGDRIMLIASASSGTPKLKFSGSNWITAGTATLSSGLRAVIVLVFDGAKWVEVSRVVQ